MKAAAALLLSGALVGFGAFDPPCAGAQNYDRPLDERAVTAQARAFGPPSIGSDKLTAADIRWLLDRQEIADCIYRYTRGLDRHDPVLIASAFWPDAQITYGAVFTSPRDEYAQWAIADDAIRFSTAHLHNITQQTIDIQGDTAHVESYLLAVEERPDQTSQLTAGRYIDRLERRNGEWRIVVREFVLDSKAKLDASIFTPDKTCQPSCGTWDKADLSYARPLPRRPAFKKPNPPGTPLPDPAKTPSAGR